jgi:hemolysin III
VFGASALYHCGRWSSASVRVWTRRLDRSAIFLVVAGTYTPFALLAFEGALATALLAVVWVGAAAGLLLLLAGVDVPR